MNQPNLTYRPIWFACSSALLAFVIATSGCDQPASSSIAHDKNEPSQFQDPLEPAVTKTSSTAADDPAVTDQASTKPLLPFDDAEHSLQQATTQESQPAGEPGTPKGMLEKASDLFQSARQKSSEAASGTGKWVQDAFGSATQSGEQTVDETLKWASDSFQSLKNQGLTTAKDTSEWLSEDWNNMDRWEYKIVTITSNDGNDDDPTTTKLNELGNQGWECFHVAGERFFFKKPSNSFLRSLPFKDVIKLVPLMNAGNSDK